MSPRERKLSDVVFRFLQKRKDKDAQEGGFVALGTTDGKVVLWDLKRGVVAHILGAVSD